MRLGSKRWHRARRLRARIARTLTGLAFRVPESNTPYHSTGVLCLLCGDEADWEDCYVCGGEGYFDGYEEDPLWYDPGEDVPCRECDGDGGHYWCIGDRCPTSMIRKVFPVFPPRIHSKRTGKTFLAGSHYDPAN